MTLLDLLLGLWLAGSGIGQALHIDRLPDPLQPGVALVLLPALGVAFGGVFRNDDPARIRSTLRVEAGGALAGLYGLLLFWAVGELDVFGLGLLGGCFVALARSGAVILGFVAPDPLEVGRWVGRGEVHGALAAFAGAYVLGPNVLILAGTAVGLAVVGLVEWPLLTTFATGILVLAAWLALERWVAYVPRSRFGTWILPLRVIAYGTVGIGALVSAYQFRGAEMIALGVVGASSIGLGAWLLLGPHDRFDARIDGLWFIGPSGAERIPWADVVRYHAVEISRSPSLQIVVKGARGQRVFLVVGVRHPTPLADLVEGIERAFARIAMKGAA